MDVLPALVDLASRLVDDAADGLVLKDYTEFTALVVFERDGTATAYIDDVGNLSWRQA